ncbi:MAG: hypothetical protein H0X25_07135 [Acidobacteriales bacterium]|nr:hypothetical protein [Terriglobales bacterium]
MTEEISEFTKFDAVVKKLLNVSHDELKEREKEWKEKQRAAKAARNPPKETGK